MPPLVSLFGSSKFWMSTFRNGLNLLCICKVCSMCVTLLFHQFCNINNFIEFFVTLYTLVVYSQRIIFRNYKKTYILPPFQIIGRLTFSILSLTTHLLQKFVQNITSFCCGLFYQYKFFKNDLNLTIFAQIFWIRRVVKFGVKKSQTTYNLEWRE